MVFHIFINCIRYTHTPYLPEYAEVAYESATDVVLLQVVNRVHTEKTDRCKKDLDVMP